MKTENAVFSIGGIWSQAKPSLVPGIWGSICLSYAAQDALWTYYSDGRGRASGTLASSKGEGVIQGPVATLWSPCNARDVDVYKVYYTYCNVR